VQTLNNSLRSLPHDKLPQAQAHSSAAADKGPQPHPSASTDAACPAPTTRASSSFLSGGKQRVAWSRRRGEPKEVIWSRRRGHVLREGADASTSPADPYDTGAPSHLRWDRESEVSGVFACHAEQEQSPAADSGGEGVVAVSSPSSNASPSSTVSPGSRQWIAREAVRDEAIRMLRADHLWCAMPPAVTLPHTLHASHTSLSNTHAVLVSRVAVNASTSIDSATLVGSLMPHHERRWQGGARRGVGRLER
jgi:hypothetical protein